MTPASKSALVKRYYGPLVIKKTIISYVMLYLRFYILMLLLLNITSSSKSSNTSEAISLMRLAHDVDIRLRYIVDYDISLHYFA